HEIDVFAVTRGPGSFTGVRIGLATIQGLALALGKPVCAMSTHEAIALGEGSPHVERIAVFDDAGRGEFYVSVFNGVEEVVPARLATAGEKKELTDDASLVIAIADFLQHGNVAGSCARRALELTESGAADRYRDITPIYVRLAEAEVKLRQKTAG
ncbi:MAG TPA: tRNA (adenosine(37)-N6)-threonylcarbamoyltransferase complex dimerization subunit type 1 TsaB, partial [Thermoanaerobaculia bacterium]